MKYIEPETTLHTIELESSIFAGSNVPTVEKEFTVKTDNYEVEDNNFFDTDFSFE